MSRTVTSQLLADEFEGTTKKMHDDPAAYRGFSFPSPWFMRFVGGWGRDWYSLIYGKPGSGKSSFLNTAAIELGYKKVPFIYVSLEESLMILAQKVAANIGNINRIRFRDVTLEAGDWPKLSDAARDLRDFHGYWSEGLYDWDDLVATLQALDPLPDVLLQDYLQLGRVDNPRGMTDNVARYGKNLAALAKGNILKNKDGTPHPVSVIAAAQLNDINEVLHSRDSDRDGDLIIEVQTIDNGAGDVLPDQRRIKIRKARYGGLDTTTMAFFGSQAKFGDIYKGTQSGPIPAPKP